MKTRNERGFTLIEMLVVIGIITVISGIVLANNSKFGGQVLLQNLAYDIALSIRQAQVYGISVQRFKSTNTFAPAYGVHFRTSSTDRYQTFADRNPVNGRYDLEVNELVEESSIQSGYIVSDICTADSDGVQNCSINELHITFRRPESEAYIVADDTVLTFNSEGRLDPSDQEIHAEARIRVRSPRGDERDVVVNANGQISVENPDN